MLIIDDDSEIADLMADHLREHGYTVARAFDGEQGLRLLAEAPPALVLLDQSLPKRSGLDVFRMIRATGNIPVIFIGSHDSETDRVVSLELGADDYVTKPFSPRELTARIGAVLRRSRCSCGAVRHTAAAAGTSGELEIDRTNYQVRRNGRPLSLTPTEFRILDAFARHPGQVLSRTQLFELVSSEGDVFDRTLDKHIANLRKKIEIDPAKPRHLSTVFGLGYKFIP